MHCHHSLQKWNIDSWHLTTARWGAVWRRDIDRPCNQFTDTSTYYLQAPNVGEAWPDLQWDKSESRWSLIRRSENFSLHNSHLNILVCLEWLAVHHHWLQWWNHVSSIAGTCVVLDDPIHLLPQWRRRSTHWSDHLFFCYMTTVRESSKSKLYIDILILNSDHLWCWSEFSSENPIFHSNVSIHIRSSGSGSIHGHSARYFSYGSDYFISVKIDHTTLVLISTTDSLLWTCLSCSSCCRYESNFLYFITCWQQRNNKVLFRSSLSNTVSTSSALTAMCNTHWNLLVQLSVFLDSFKILSLKRKHLFQL